MKMKSKRYLIIILFLFITYALSSCNSIENNINIDEEIFIKNIEAITPTIKSTYVYIDNLPDMIETTKPNLIVRCKIKSHGKTSVIDPLKKYSNEDLLSNDKDLRKSASSFIYTPYDIEILEVYHGNINKSGDVIQYNAPYGIINGYETKKSGQPILYIENEYILFLRADNIYGVITYSLAFTPCSALKLNSNNGTFELYDNSWGFIYSNYNYKTSALIGDLKQLILKNNYSTEIEYLGSIAN